MARTSADALRRCAIVAALALALLAALELTTRVWLFGAAGLDPRRVDSVLSIGRSGFLTPSTTPGVSFELRPNLDGWFKLARFGTNSRGLHEREVPVAKPEGEVRVAVLGASYTMPSGVALEDAFHSRLEARFRAGPPRRGVEFVNFGVAGYVPPELVAVLRHKALDYDPDLVLVSATGRSAGQFMRRADAGPLAWRPRDEAHPFFGSFLWKLVRARSRSFDVAGEVRRPRRSERSADTVGFETVLEALGRTSRAAGVPIVLVRLQTADRPESARDEELRRGAVASGLAYLDTRAAFAGTDPRDFWIHPLDRHPNAAAHARFADAIGDFLAAGGWLDARSAGLHRDP